MVNLLSEFGFRKRESPSFSSVASSVEDSQPCSATASERSKNVGLIESQVAAQIEMENVNELSAISVPSVGRSEDASWINWKRR